jgi:hypothetical protein
VPPSRAPAREAARCEVWGAAKRKDAFQKAGVPMLIVVKAIDAYGKAVCTPPVTKREALMKVWDFKTSGCTQIRTFRATTNEEINIL